VPAGTQFVYEGELFKVDSVYQSMCYCVRVKDAKPFTFSSNTVRFYIANMLGAHLSPVTTRPTETHLVHQSKVELLDVMGDDLAVVNAARVSFNKESEWDTAIHYSFDPDKNGGMGGHDEIPVEQLAPRDAKLIQYLADHNHWSPFSHCYLKFRIKAPISVARQLQKHTVGLAWNEVSRRYVDYVPEVYEPTEWRAKTTNKKQGSSSEVITLPKGNVYDEAEDLTIYQHAVRGALEAYQELLDCGVCEEQARLVLPQGAMTEWVWSGSLSAFIRVVQLRTSSDAQQETAEVARQIESCISNLFPVSYSAYFDK